MDRFEIAFSGELVLGAELAQARAGVQRLFNASEQLLEQLFSGRRVVIKQSVDQATALKYQKAFAGVGAILEVKPLTPAQPQEQSQEQPQPAQPQPSAATSTIKPETAQTTRPAQPSGEVSAPDFGLAPAGADLLTNKPEPQVLDIDISAIKLAPSGSDAGYNKQPDAPVQVSIAHLQLVD